jgi:ECF sigma factor
MSNVSGILSAMEHGDPHAAAQLLPLVYDELRKLAAQKLPGYVHGVAFAPDGRHLATVNGNGTVYVLRLAKP